MSAEALVREGRLQEALKALTERVRAEPAQARHRVFLFQLLCVLGQWGRALNQLNVAGEMDSANLLMVNTYRPLLQCEALRAQVFAGSHTPVVFGAPQPWVARLLQALGLDAQGHAAKAAEARAEAFDQAESAGGTLNGEAFAWIADADSRLGPCLELIVEGRYGWAPWAHLQALKLEPPADLRDLVWAPAQITWASGGQTIGFVPTRYAGSEAAEDAALQLARKTEWRELSPDNYAGLGQRLLATDGGEYALLEAREIVLQPTASA